LSDPREVRDRLHVYEQHIGGENGDRELYQDPPVPDEPPLGPEGLDESGHERGNAERDDGEPGGHVHCELGGTHHHGIWARKTGHGERQEAGDGPEPADRGRDVRR
jgi:hypothetical protein